VGTVTRSHGVVGRRVRGSSVDELPSGALRVRVYAGVDPVSKRRHDLIEIIPPGPGVDKQARRARDRLINQVKERRNPRTRATVDQLPERYLDQFDGASRADAAVPDPGPLPLRGRYLPDLKAMRELPDRLCAGGFSRYARSRARLIRTAASRIMPCWCRLRAEPGQRKLRVRLPDRHRGRGILAPVRWSHRG
jgi:hypothetical protein